MAPNGSGCSYLFCTIFIDSPVWVLSHWQSTANVLFVGLSNAEAGSIAPTGGFHSDLRRFMDAFGDRMCLAQNSIKSSCSPNAAVSQCCLEIWSYAGFSVDALWVENWNFDRAINSAFERLLGRGIARLWYQMSPGFAWGWITGVRSHCCLGRNHGRLLFGLGSLTSSKYYSTICQTLNLIYFASALVDRVLVSFWHQVHYYF